MSNFRVTVSRGVDGKFRKLEDLLKDFQEEYLRGFANSIVLDSPVDTGTYMKSHVISTSPQSGNVSSHGEERNQPWGPIAQSTLNRLYSEIATIPEGTNNVYISNISEHADDVEYRHGYEVFSRARAKSGAIAAEAEARARARNR